ncbi:MAG: hypothetical protein AAF360_09155 [Pseudomonadota bacterium]
MRRAAAPVLAALIAAFALGACGRKGEPATPAPTPTVEETDEQTSSPQG